MKIPTIIVTSVVTSFALLGLVSCDSSPSTVVITETREVTSRDVLPKLFATSEDQFISPQARQELTGQSKLSAPLAGEHPANLHPDYIGMDWEQKASTQFRLFNYNVPGGEAYVSISGGGLLPNINRWLKQFQSESISDLSTLKTAPLGGNKLDAYIVRAVGNFASGMGRPNKDNQALLAVIAPYPAAGEGQFISVKLIAEAPISESLEQEFFTFINKLHWHD